MAQHNQPSRRAMLAGLAFAAPAAIVAPVSIAHAIDNPDAALVAAWERRVAAYSTFNALPPTEPEDRVNGKGFTALEARIWSVVDEAEEVIRSTVARTTRGAAIQIWCALAHCTETSEHDEAVTRGDLAALEIGEKDLDWSARLALAALRSLQQMEG